jgi:hypothetical protein
LQFKKIKWVAKFVKPVAFVVYLSRRESKPAIEINEPRITVTYKGG